MAKKYDIVPLTTAQQRRDATQIERGVGGLDVEAPMSKKYRLYGIYDDKKLAAVTRVDTNPLKEWKRDDDYELVAALNPEVSIASTAVLPKYRRRGMATALRRHLQSQYNTIITGISDESNKRAMQRLNQRTGFKRFWERGPSSQYVWEKTASDKDLARFERMYEAFDQGHGPSHVQAVREQAKALAQAHAPSQEEMADLAALLHDIGISKDRKRHEVHGAEIVLANPKLQEKLSPRRLAILAQAVRQHRASTGKPRSMLAKIVSDADRAAGRGASEALVRSIEYGKKHFPELSEKEQILRAARHLREKYGPGGIGLRTYFPETRGIIEQTMAPVIEAGDDLERLKALMAKEGGIDLPTQDEIFRDVVAKLPQSIASRVMHASGGLPDMRGVSDVDAAILEPNHKNLLPLMPPGTEPEDRGDHTIYHVPGYAREVNIYATSDPVRAKRAVIHRANEMILEDQFPQLAAVASVVKARGLSTEKAWAKVLDLPGDPYDAMLDTNQVMAAAMKKTASDGIRMPKEESMAKKEAQVLTPRQVQQKQELEAWQRWSQDKNPQDFKFLLDSFMPFMHHMGRRYYQTTSLPKSAVEADLIQHFHRAMETYDPAKGAQLNTHIGEHLRHTGRFLRTYQNIGKIPEPRARQIGMMQARESFLTESLGRPPSSPELSDDLGLSLKDVELLRKEIRKDILVDPVTSGLADIAQETPRALEQLQFLHVELNPEQQNVLEYTYGMHGRGAIDNNEELARILGMTPQKVRAIKRQIAKRFEKRYR